VVHLLGFLGLRERHGHSNDAVRAEVALGGLVLGRVSLVVSSLAAAHFLWRLL
jgi:hypothetical protein